MRISLAASILTFHTLVLLPSCVNEVEPGDDFFEPEDTRDNVDMQGLHDCSERPDTGYQRGDQFSISVVSVDSRPVEVDTANAYIALQNAAAADGVSVRIVSGFRTDDQQEYLYGCYVDCNCNNCNLAARPGYSNHQSGHALDLNTRDRGVLSWLNANGARFGFRRTVPSEPWHWEWWGNGADHAGPCGSGSANAREAPALPATGGVIDDGDDAFSLGGPSSTLRAQDGGEQGDLVWTMTTDRSEPVNFATWNLRFAEAGRYRVEAFVPGTVATSETARYVITHQGVNNTMIIDQRGADRWVPLGTFAFAAGGNQRIRVNDNTGEAGNLERKLAFDAVAFIRIDEPDPTQQTPPPATCSTLVIITTGGPLNVRRDPSTHDASIGTVDDGATVRRIDTVIGQSVSGSTDWHLIDAGGVTGYVAAAFTRCSDAP